MYRSVIFDMDGVLIDSEALHAQAWVQVLEQYDVERGLDLVQHGVGVPDEDFCRLLRSDLDLDVPSLTLLEQKREAYRKLAADSLQLYPGVLSLLDALRDRCLLGLATASPRIEVEMTLDRFALRDYFHITGSRDEVRDAKPCPDIYQYVAHELRLHPNRCVAIEDSPTGITAAKAAGMGVVGVASTHSRHSLAAADAVIPELVPTHAALNALAIASCDPVS